MSYPNLELSLNEYQRQATKTADYPGRGHNMLYPALKLNGEAGEVAEKVGKHWRNEGITNPNELNAGQKIELIKELGDVLWYIAALSEELGVDLSYVARTNINKLSDRAKRGVIKSTGDNR
jgi:NTP pyrophosphatase (non-canonical NTP hydrolase)